MTGRPIPPLRCLLVGSILWGALAAAHPRPSQAGVGLYLKNRALDLFDLIGLRVSGAKDLRGFGLYARATAVGQLGFVSFDGTYSGIDRRAVGIWREKKIQAALGPLAFTSVETKTRRGNGFAHEAGEWGERADRGIVRNGEFWDDGRGHPLSFGAEYQFGPVPGLEVRVYPMELIDFALGWVGIDTFNDDLMAPPKAESERPRDTGREIEVLEIRAPDEGAEGLPQTAPATPRPPEEPASRPADVPAPDSPPEPPDPPTEPGSPSAPESPTAPKDPPPVESESNPPTR